MYVYTYYTVHLFSPNVNSLLIHLCLAIPCNNLLFVFICLVSCFDYTFTYNSLRSFVLNVSNIKHVVGFCDLSVLLNSWAYVMDFCCFNKHIWSFFWFWGSFFLSRSFLYSIFCYTVIYMLNISVQFNRSVMSNSLWPHELQHAKLPCPSPTPGAYSYSCSLRQWCHPTTSSSIIPFSSRLQSFLRNRVFSNESILRNRWPEYWNFSFSISSFNEYSGLISFRMYWLGFLAVQGTLNESAPKPQFKSINLSVLSFL